MKEKSSIKKTLVFLTAQRRAPKYTIILPILIYVAFYLGMVILGRSEGSITLMGSQLPLSSLTGVFSALGNLCLVVMVLKYDKLGFVISMIILSVQYPILLMMILVRHNMQGVPGFFTNTFTMIMIIIIYRSHRRMERDQKRMRDLFEQTATALVNAIDAKDTYTKGHSSRVAEYSRRLAELSGKDEKECDEVYYTALLHDVGKIGVPSTIINKAGRLTNEEYETVKQHSVLGAQILETISEYPYLEIGAHYHHERYDGKGYPEGLKGEEIPEIARIVGVADAYDAMTSKRSYRDPIPQEKVREEIVKGTGTQFDPAYARLMLHLIDVDTEYEMQERAQVEKAERRKELTIGEYRSAYSSGILIDAFEATLRLAVNSDDEAAGIAPVPSMVLFDAMDGIVHTDERKKSELAYFEYGELWFDGRSNTEGARKIEVKTKETGAADVKRSGEYKIEAVRVRDHARIRISGKEWTREAVIALPDNSRFLYIAFTGEHCRFSDLHSEKSEQESSSESIPRIAEEISFIKGPAGDVPNVQIDGFRTDASRGIRIHDGLRIAFHAMSLPVARLVWHCPFVDIFTSDDGIVEGENYRDLALARLDGECWEYDPSCFVKERVVEHKDFSGWEAWMEFNHKGYDVVVTFRFDHNEVTIITENCGISIRDVVQLDAGVRSVFAAITGDEVAITNIRVLKDAK